jgi:hypothetical protein
MAVPAWVAEVCGFAGTAGCILMLLPQIILNARKKSTEGLSLGLVLLWHSAALLSSAFYLTQPDGFIALLSIGSFAVSSAILEGQTAAFRPAMSEKTSWQRCAVLLGVTALSLSLSAGLVAALTYLLRTLPSYAAEGMGDYLPSLLLALGFLPQFREFLGRWSVDGYSFGVTFFDILGSAGNTIKLLASPGSSLDSALVEALPFLVIIAMHGILLTIVAVITCRPRTPSGEAKAMAEP